MIRRAEPRVESKHFSVIFDAQTRSEARCSIRHRTSCATNEGSVWMKPHIEHRLPLFVGRRPGSGISTRTTREQRPWLWRHSGASQSARTRLRWRISAAPRVRAGYNPRSRAVLRADVTSSSSTVCRTTFPRSCAALLRFRRLPRRHPAFPEAAAPVRRTARRSCRSRRASRGR